MEVGKESGKSRETLCSLSLSPACAPASILCAEPQPLRAVKPRRRVPGVADRTPGDALAPALAPVRARKTPREDSPAQPPYPARQCGGADATA